MGDLKKKAKRQKEKKQEESIKRQQALVEHSYRPDQKVELTGQEMIMLLTYVKKAFDSGHKEIVAPDASGRIAGYLRPADEVIEAYQIAMTIHNRQFTEGNTFPIEQLQEEYKAQLEKLKQEGDVDSPVADTSIVVEADGKSVEITPESTEDTLEAEDSGGKVIQMTPQEEPDPEPQAVA